MGTFKKIAAVLIVALAFGAAASGASASQFTASGPGEIRGTSAESVFGFDGVEVKCGATSSHGIAEAFEMSEVHLHATVSKCAAHVSGLGIPEVAVSPVEIGLTANGTVDFGPFEIVVSLFGPACTVTVPSQGPVSSVSPSGGYDYHLTGMTYTTSGFLCEGGLDTNGTFTGTSTYTMIGGGGVFGWDP